MHAPSERTIDIKSRRARCRYYAPNMAFRHPLCAVSPAPDSRADLLAILAWYRILSPVLVDIDAVNYDAERRTAYVEVTQVFCVRWSPFRRAPAKYVPSAPGSSRSRSRFLSFIAPES